MWAAQVEIMWNHIRSYHSVFSWYCPVNYWRNYCPQKVWLWITLIAALLCCLNIIIVKPDYIIFIYSNLIFLCTVLYFQLNKVYTIIVCNCLYHHCLSFYWSFMIEFVYNNFSYFASEEVAGEKSLCEPSLRQELIICSNCWANLWPEFYCS